MQPRGIHDKDVDPLVVPTHLAASFSSFLAPSSSRVTLKRLSLPQLMPRRCFHVDFIYRTEPDTVSISSFDNIPSVFFKKGLIFVYVQASCPIIEAKGLFFCAHFAKGYVADV